ncbi:hypothetical protein ACJMK2_024031 [Sinanodonta woodiana]|uniref:Granulins domain-containing protein n=1 Tax=Sinanodonta woodiana TaxID=1069815 RepID=A0ABD3T6Y2_SINWO
MSVVILALCILANTLFVEADKPQEVLEPEQASASMALSSNVGVLCPNRITYCPWLQPCCATKSGYTCCKYSLGACCSNGLRCCPRGTRCVLKYFCI